MAARGRKRKYMSLDRTDLSRRIGKNKKRLGTNGTLGAFCLIHQSQKFRWRHDAWLFYIRFQKVLVSGKKDIGVCRKGGPEKGAVLGVPNQTFLRQFVLRDRHQFQGQQRDRKKFFQRRHAVREPFVEDPPQLLHVLLADQSPVRVQGGFLICFAGDPVGVQGGGDKNIGVDEDPHCVSSSLRSSRTSSMTSSSEERPARWASPLISCWSSCMA